jgi:hypothetical protein
MHEPVSELTLETPAGLIHVRADCADGRVQRVTFRNVPAFVAHLDRTIDGPQLGKVVVDVAYGGMFYVIADAEPFGLRLTRDDQGRSARAAAGGAPGAAGLRGHHDRAAFRIGARCADGAGLAVVRLPNFFRSYILYSSILFSSIVTGCRA